jgi:CRISPR-associated endoribonuclease Cas6
VPTRIVVGLVPVDGHAVPPRHTGPAVYAALLKAVGGVDPALAARLHDSPKFKSFTITPVLGEDDVTPTVAGRAARFEVGLLEDTDTATVLAALTATETVVIGRTVYRSVSARLSDARSYEELAEGAEPGTVWSFDLVTPVSFATARGQGARRQQPWPDAARVFANLAGRWDTFAPAAGTLPDAALVAVGEHLECCAGAVQLRRYLVEPSRRDHEDGYRVGATGQVSYRLAMPARLPRVALRAVDTLARFAQYAGMGDRTAMGMGYVRLRPAEPPDLSDRY